MVLKQIDLNNNRFPVFNCLLRKSICTTYFTLVAYYMQLNQLINGNSNCVLQRRRTMAVITQVGRHVSFTLAGDMQIKFPSLIQKYFNNIIIEQNNKIITSQTNLTNQILRKSGTCTSKKRDNKPFIAFKLNKTCVFIFKQYFF